MKLCVFIRIRKWIPNSRFVLCNLCVSAILFFLHRNNIWFNNIVMEWYKGMFFDDDKTWRNVVLWSPSGWWAIKQKKMLSRIANRKRKENTNVSYFYLSYISSSSFLRFYEMEAVKSCFIKRRGRIKSVLIPFSQLRHKET